MRRFYPVNETGFLHAWVVCPKSGKLCVNENLAPFVKALKTEA